MAKGKLRDLVSRFAHEPLRLVDIDERKKDKLYVACSLLLRQFPWLESVQRGLLRMLVESTANHGPRSMDRVVSTLAVRGEPKSLTFNDNLLTSPEALASHIATTWVQWHDWRNDTAIVKLKR